MEEMIERRKEMRNDTCVILCHPTAISFDSTMLEWSYKHLIKRISGAYLCWCQETAGNTAFTRHDDSVLGQDANTRSGVVDSFNSIFDLYGSNYSSNNECERCEGEELLEDFGNKEFQRQHPSSKNSKD